MGKRVILIVLDSVGIGELPDAGDYGDEGSNTLLAASRSPYFHMENLAEAGLFQIDGIRDLLREEGTSKAFSGAVGRLAERSAGKDTTTGHWEIAGIVSEEPMPLFPEGFPEELVAALERETGRKVLCNRPYSGTEVIRDYGEEQRRTGDLIVYTSADSVLQIAAHEETVSVDELYRCCEIARKLCTGPFAVGRVIARPFAGDWPFTRTSRRHDYSLMPPKDTMLDFLAAAGRQVRGVGKIYDIFAGKGLTHTVRTSGNEEGIEKTLAWIREDFEGLLFTNLVDYDMLYGHRNDVDGYAKALTYFDGRLPELLAAMKEEDILMITADHGCDPSTASTDHSREYVPLVILGKPVKPNVNLGTRAGFSDIAASILAYLDVPGETAGKSFASDIIKKLP